MPERTTVVIVPVSDAGTTAYRLQYPDLRKTGSGLFVSQEWARKYAAKNGWRVAERS